VYASPARMQGRARSVGLQTSSVGSRASAVVGLKPISFGGRGSAAPTPAAATIGGSPALSSRPKKCASASATATGWLAGRKWPESKRTSSENQAIHGQSQGCQQSGRGPVQRFAHGLLRADIGLDAYHLVAALAR
jgi:hypothetical protein